MGTEIKIKYSDEDARLLAAMLEVENDPIATPEEVEEFKAWLKNSQS